MNLLLNKKSEKKNSANPAFQENVVGCVPVVRPGRAVVSLLKNLNLFLQYMINITS